MAALAHHGPKKGTLAEAVDALFDGDKHERRSAYRPDGGEDVPVSFAQDKWW